MFAKILKPHIYPLIAFSISAALLLGALGFQHIGGYAPCQMCFWQRHAHKAVMVVSGLVLLYYGVTKNERALTPLVTVIILTTLISFAMAFWHVGVEYGWWEGPKSCMAATPGTMPSGDDIMNALGGKVKMPSCSDAPWHLFGLSMAAYNAIISLSTAVIGALSLRNS